MARNEGNAMKKYNSALYWLPCIWDGGLPVPTTEFVIYHHPSAVRVLEAEAESDYELPIEGVKDAADRVGYPVFIRSDLASAKHDGPRHYRANSPKDIERILWAIVEDGEMKFWLTPETPSVLLVREWLELNVAFWAFGGHGIAREFRYFTSNGNVVCRHFYWPEEAIKFYSEKEPPTKERWTKALRAMSRISQKTDDVLGLLARGAAKRCSDHPNWSVDFAQDVKGKWWLIDMAIAERSWHPEHPHKNT